MALTKITSKQLTHKLLAAGAVVRSLFSKLGDTVSVMDFGAVGDGIVDDTAAIQAAFSYMSGLSYYQKRYIFFPAGLYKITSTLTVPTFVDLVGAGRWNTRLMFALTTDGTALNLAGVDTNNRVRSSIRRMRIDGTNCTAANVIGIECNWNQSQQPILDEVTIYGGYGSTTGFKTGLAFTAGGNNWICSFMSLGIEGCHTDGLLIDNSSAGAANSVNFIDCRFENQRNRNVYLRGLNNDILSQQINFIACTIEASSYSNTGVGASVLLDGVRANFDKCWFESSSTPNWPAYEVDVVSGKASFHDCHWAWSQRSIRATGTVSLSGLNVILSSVSALTINTNGKLSISGELQFFAGGTPIVFSDGTGLLAWSRDNMLIKTSNYTVLSKDFSSTITNHGTKQNITITMANAPSGAKLAVAQGMTSIRSTAYRWVLSAGGTSEYYLELSTGGNPGFSDPTKFYDFATEKTKGTVGTLVAGTWAYGDNDALGYNTIYYRTPTSVDPDTATVGTLNVTYTITISPTNNQRIPFPAFSPSDSIVTDGIPGTAMQMRMCEALYWVSENKSGTWA